MKKSTARTPNGTGGFQQPIPLSDKGFDKSILFVDVMTDPWRNPFIRIKYRNKNKDVGSIFLNNEEAIDKLIDALKKAKPHLNDYRELIKRLEQT